MKLKLKNFQSISDAEIDFQPGVAVIQGESNQGKTAILRAIKAIINNPQKTKHYIKRHQKSAQVTLENNGNTLTWERTKSSTNYIYKGEVFQKASNRCADDFCDLGFVKTSKGDLLNLTDEWNLLFPFGYSDTELFKLFEDLFSITDSAKVLEGMKGDETSCNKDKLIEEDKLARTKKQYELIQFLLQSHNLSQADIIKKVLTKKNEDLIKLKEKLKSVVAYNSISNSEVVSEPFNSDELLKVGKQSLELFKACSRASQLPVNANLPEMKYFSLGTEMLGKLKKAEIDFQAEQRKRENLVINQQELERVLEDCKKIWQSIDVCPLCGAEMNNGD